MLNAGTYLNKRYEIVKRIGTGGMADVYRGKDHKLRRYVAIKVLKREFSEDTTFLVKFQQEAQAAAGMLHPNVVNVYDVGEDHGYNYMVMELVDGITLKEYIQKKGRLPDKEVISIAIQMASGLDAAHKKNIVHRDVKPQNVMISTEGKVKVTDFGIAKPTSSNTISTNVMGSVHYTSPEQARGGVCDIQSDIYSTGITIYEMITGTIPFDGESTVSVAVKHLQEDMLPPSEYTPNMYYSLEQIIIKCTQKNASRRYNNMDELILDLKHSLMDPDGDFVKIGPLLYAPIHSNEDDYEDEDDYENDDDYEDEDDYEDDYEVRKRARKSKEDVDPKIKNMNKILAIVAAVIVLFAIIFIAGQAIGFFNFGAGDIGAETEEIPEEVVVPDLSGLTEDEARELLNESFLGYKKKASEKSPTLEEGLIMSQDIQAGDKVDPHTTINVIVSSGIAEVLVTLPDVVGMSEDDAKKTLFDMDILMDSQADYSADVEAGHIISMNPEAGAEVAEDSTVTVVVSKGPAPIEAPDLSGLSNEAAKAKLAELELEAKVTEEYSDTVDAGKVISQTTKAGTKLVAGDSVSYVVSKGKEPVEVPRLIGEPINDVIEALNDLGLKYKTVTKYSNTITADKVISANISAGTKVQVGTTIELVVSDGPEPSEPSEPTTPDPDLDTDGDGSDTTSP